MKLIIDDGILIEVDSHITINDIFRIFISVSSDINQHLFLLHLLAKECEHITEFGTRYCHSTFAILAAKRPKFISYDLYNNANIKLALMLSEHENINFIFKQENVLNVEIENTDMLFIDTWHKYDQLINELNLHAKNVNKYIVLHDTTSYEYKDERDWNSDIEEIIIENKKYGLWPAIEDFLKNNDQWEILVKFTHNNGLTILKRKII